MSYCQLCGRQIPDGQKICAVCSSAWEQPQAVPVQVQPTPPQPKPKAKKNDHLPQVILGAAIVAMAVFFILSCLMGSRSAAKAGAAPLQSWSGGTGVDDITNPGPDTFTVTAPYAGELEGIPELPAGEDSEYVLPGSDSTYIAEGVIAAMSAQELRLARNEIYARHGRIFTSEDLVMHFTSKSWYQPLYDGESFDALGDSVLNEYEIANLQLIQAYESLYATGGGF